MEQLTSDSRKWSSVGHSRRLLRASRASLRIANKSAALTTCKAADQLTNERTLPSIGPAVMGPLLYHALPRGVAHGNLFAFPLLLCEAGGRRLDLALLNRQL